MSEELERERAARQEAQRQLVRYKDLLARARVDLVREMREQGWCRPGEASAPPVEGLLVMAVECGVIRMTQVFDADLQDALTAFAKRLAASPSPASETPVQHQEDGNA